MGEENKINRNEDIKAKFHEFEEKLRDFEKLKELKPLYDEIKYKVISIMMTNETFGLKFQNIKNTEISHENDIKMLQNTINNLIRKNESQEKEIIALKETINKLEQKFEKEGKENEKCIIMKLNEDEKEEGKVLKQIMKRNVVPYVSLKNGIYKINDEEWIRKNFDIMTEHCSKIYLKNIDELDIKEDIVFSNNIKIESEKKTNLNITTTKRIYITDKAKVEMKNINIMDCYFDQDDIINVQNQSKLIFKGGYINNNYGKGTIFKIKDKCSLELLETVFEKNKNSSNKLPTCIDSAKNTSVIINDCEFLNHNYHEYQLSGKLIIASGNLKIYSTKFKNNKIIDIQDNCFTIGSFGNNVIMDNVVYEKCGVIYIQDAISVNLDDSKFTENSAHFGNGGCLHIKNSNAIKIENCRFIKNECHGWNAGAIYFQNITSIIKLIKCFFEENKCAERYYGGALYFSKAPSGLIECSFRRNTAAHGGGIYRDASRMNCESCAFENNRATGCGGAIYSDRGQIQNMECTTFINNVASSGNDVYTHYKY